MGDYITQDELDLNRFIVESEDHSTGALVIFVGTVRNTNAGQQVDGMTYEAHIPLAEKALKAIEAEIFEQFDVQYCRIQHRIGKLKLGEASVVIVVRSVHRDAGYQASRYAIEEIKRRVPIWKHEHYIDGASRYLDGIPLERK